MFPPMQRGGRDRRPEAAATVWRFATEGHPKTLPSLIRVKPRMHRPQQTYAGVWSSEEMVLRHLQHLAPRGARTSEAGFDASST